MTSPDSDPIQVKAAQFAQLVPELRSQFPSLSRTTEDGSHPISYLDGPAGSQVPQSVIDAVANYYLHHNANTYGSFATSRETNALLDRAQQVAADFFNAADVRECVFGPNMTTLTMALSRAMAKRWQQGDRIVVTQLDHDGNVTPWKLAASDVGAEVATVRIETDSATLDTEDFERQLTRTTKLVAFTCASNSVGSKTDVKRLVDLAHQAGAEVYLDAVHWAPHNLIDVQAWKADYCVCSAYKFFGPHVGLLYGRLDCLEDLPAYKLRPAPEHSPGKWMTGTQNFAAIAGAAAAIEYVSNIGRQMHSTNETAGSEGSLSRREALQTAYSGIEAYERKLVTKLLDGLRRIDGVQVFGIADVNRLAERVPTVALTLAGKPSGELAEQLGRSGIFCWAGHYYAVDVAAALGQQPHGMVRLGILHYNTEDDIDRTLNEIERIAST